ncbi:TlpA family protein disulfide reductase [Tautonia marina]|uniref:TlpA family protein disulfide reductase n=1 Tax=Tautonia marina TaxID=2653855 RepID=UPI0012606D75|nr:TlpA disulfide reductase family protein [Tautonia marina]
MIQPARPLTTWLTLATFSAAVCLLGCSEPAGDAIEPTPDEVVSPEIPGDSEPAETLEIEAETTVVEPPAEPEPAPAPTPEPAPVEPEPAPEPEPAAEPAEPEPSDTADLELKPVTYEELKAHIAESDAPLTLVDCWASWCDPCKENFPHVLEMASSFEDKGLKVIALSFDAGTEVDDIDEAQIKEAKRFLSAMDVSKIENLRHGQLLFESFEAFNVTTIPAVFLYDGEGNEVARFTYDDPDNQFTYDEVEAKVAELLEAQ